MLGLRHNTSPQLGWQRLCCQCMTALCRFHSCRKYFWEGNPNQIADQFCRKTACERHKIASEHKKIACEPHKIVREHEKLPVIVIKLRMNVYSDTKCRLVPIKLRVVRLPRLRLSGVMIWDQIERSSIVYYKYMNFIPLLYNLKHCHAISAQCAKMESNNDGISKEKML